MTYTQEGERVTLEMTRDDFDTLILALGYAAGAAHANPDLTLFWRWIAFANRLNATNPNFTPYEIPPEFAGEGKS